MKIHNLLKSGSEICSLRTACVLVMKFFALPEVPAAYVRAMPPILYMHGAVILTLLLDFRHLGEFCRRSKSGRERRLICARPSLPHKDEKKLLAFFEFKVFAL